MRHFICSLLLIFTLTTLWANTQDGIPEKPEQQRLVNDLANILSPRQELELEAKLVAYSKESSTQVAVVTVNSLNGYERADFATRLAQKWGVGSAKYDNGILLLVKPKTTSKGQVFIATGYGLEGAVTDLATGQIVRNILIPHFRKNDYYGGIYKASDALIALSKGEYKAPPSSQNKKSNFPFGLILIVVFFILFVLLSSTKKRANGQYQMSQSGGQVPMWLLLEMLTRNSGRNDFDDFSSGSGGFGGFSGGGGFGGFGGGSFGGGGAGGSW